MMKDTLERARDPNFNLKGYLQNAYVHPVFKGDDEDEDDIVQDKLDMETELVPTKRQSRRNTPAPSRRSNDSSPQFDQLWTWVVLYIWKYISTQICFHNEERVIVEGQMIKQISFDFVVSCRED